MSAPLFNDDAYLQSCTAVVTDIKSTGEVVLNQTVFYPTGGGQPGDCGILKRADGSEIQVLTTIKDKGSTDILHVLAAQEMPPKIGETIEAQINWQERHQHMRMHTAMHLVCAISLWCHRRPSQRTKKPLGF